MAEHSPEAGQRKLAAVMFTDIKGFSKKMAHNEVAAFELLQTHDALLRTVAAKHDGKVVKSIGDSLMVDFSSAVSALQAAVESQITLWNYNKDKDEFNKIEVRIGIHLGDVMVAANDLYGDGVNIASRIQSITEPTRICISADLYSQVKNKTDVEFFRIGDVPLKNIPQPIEVYEVLIPSIPELAQPSPSSRQKPSEQQLENAESREAQNASEIEAARWQEHLRAQKVDEEKEAKVRGHYEHAGEFLRDGRLDLAEIEIQEIFKIYPIHMGAQQLQAKVEEERYKKVEQERQKKIEERRTIEEEKERQIQVLAQKAEEYIKNEDFDQARIFLESIRSQSRLHPTIQGIEEHLERAESAKADADRQKTFLEEENRKQELTTQERIRKQQTRLEHARKQQAAESVRKPRKLIIAAVSTIVIVAVIVIFTYTRIVDQLFPTSNTLAILPLGSLQDSLSERALGSVAQDILQGYLSHAEGVSVVAPSRTSVKESDVARLAGMLGVRYIIHGALRKTGNAISVRIGVSDSKDGTELFSEEIGGDIPSLPTILAQVVPKILGALSIEHQGFESPSQTSNTQAYELYAEGVYLLKQGLLAEAEQCFRNSSKADSLFAPAFAGLAQVVIERSDLFMNSGGAELNEALMPALHSVSLDTRDAAGYRSFAEICFARQKFDEAERNTKICLSIRPQDPGCYRLFAQLALIGGNDELASKFASLAARINPDDADNQIVLGISQAHRKEFAQANASFIKAVALGKSDSAITVRYLLNVWAGQDRFDDIIQYSQKRLTMNPEDYRAYYWMSRAFQMKPAVDKFVESSDKAILILQRYIEKNPQDALAPAYLGLMYARKGKTDLAESAMRRAFELAPHSIEIKFRQADMYAILGKKGEAIASVKEALTKSHRFSEILDGDLNLVRYEPGFVEATTRRIDFDGFPQLE